MLFVTAKEPIAAVGIPNQIALVGANFLFELDPFTFYDPESLPLTYTTSTSGTWPTWLEFDNTSLTFSGTPEVDDVDTLVINVVASNGYLSTPSSFTITVKLPEYVSAAYIPDQQGNPSSFYTFTFDSNTFIDAFDLSLTYSSTWAGNPLPYWLNFDGPSRTFSGTPPSGSQGAYLINVTAFDGFFQPSTTFTLTILNRPPLLVLLFDQVASFVGSEILVNLTGGFLDPDTDPLNYNISIGT